MTPTTRRAVNGAPGFPAGTLAWDPVARVAAPEDRLVGAAFRFLIEGDGLPPERARELGRALGREASAGELPAFVEAFSHLGLGALHISEDAPGRVHFESPDLRGAERPKSAACALALGFVEGATQGTRGEMTLGAETRCRSRGHASCTFVVMTKLQKPPARRAERTP